MITIKIYATEDGKEPFSEFLDSLKNYTDRSRIYARLDRLENGNFGDYRSVGDSVYELRFFFGSGYRVYFGILDSKIILLLCGGDKGSQKADIKTAKKYWKTIRR